MAFVIERIPDTRILAVRGSGEGSLRESEEIVEALRRMLVAREGESILFDLRELTYVPSAVDARHIGESHGALGADYGCRMAYLAPPGAQFGVARMVEILSSFRGATAAVFDQERAAVAWLMAADERTRA